MKKSEPKLIINLNLSDPEFEKQIELAVDKYIDSILDSCAGDKVNEAITKYVDKKLDAVLYERRYDNAALVNGRRLSEYIAEIARPKVNAVISDIVAGQVSEILASKFKA